jgi:hypothetical protein
MKTVRASTLHIRRSGSATPWWSRRPWADEFSNIDTSAYLPGRHHRAPLLEPGPRKRSRKFRPQDSAWHRPVQAADRRGVGIFATSGWALQLRATVQVATPEETARLEEARRRIEFRPRNGFLHSTPVALLRARRQHGD